MFDFLNQNLPLKQGRGQPLVRRRERAPDTTSGAE